MHSPVVIHFMLGMCHAILFLELFGIRKYHSLSQEHYVYEHCPSMLRAYITAWCRQEVLTTLLGNCQAHLDIWTVQGFVHTAIVLLDTHGTARSKVIRQQQQPGQHSSMCVLSIL